MARMESTLLDTNDLFPEMTLQLINGETLTLPQGAGQGYGVIFFYRGYW